MPTRRSQRIAEQPLIPPSSRSTRSRAAATANAILPAPAVLCSAQRVYRNTDIFTQILGFLDKSDLGRCLALEKGGMAVVAEALYHTVDEKVAAKIVDKSPNGKIYLNSIRIVNSERALAEPAKYVHSRNFNTSKLYKMQKRMPRLSCIRKCGGTFAKRWSVDLTANARDSVGIITHKAIHYAPRLLGITLSESLANRSPVVWSNYQTRRTFIIDLRGKHSSAALLAELSSSHRLPENVEGIQIDTLLPFRSLAEMMEDRFKMQRTPIRLLECKQWSDLTGASLRTFLLGPGRALHELKLSSDHNDQCSISVRELPTIAKTIRNCCPHLRVLRIRVFTSGPITGRPFGNNDIIWPEAFTTTGYLQNIDIDRPWNHLNCPSIDLSIIVCIAGLAANSASCHIGGGRVSNAVRRIHRLSEQESEALQAADFALLGLGNPFDLELLEFDQNSKPIELKFTRAKATMKQMKALIDDPNMRQDKANRTMYEKAAQVLRDGNYDLSFATPLPLSLPELKVELASTSEKLARSQKSLKRYKRKSRASEGSHGQAAETAKRGSGQGFMASYVASIEAENAKLKEMYKAAAGEDAMMDDD